MMAAALIVPCFMRGKARKVTVWGNGLYQPRPDSKIAFDNFEPKTITTYGQLDIKDIFFG